ncbi:TPA: hypothetical protein ACKP8H_002774 [Serratia marcescens]|uniref:dCTP deaminase domain-containing protein n=1 Tax=Serratia marcescens TaxID=615 RepID=UPI0009495B24|nr:hypothetical protein [Serratia marcescens]MBH2826251.1 hypothetical protein [Serratia marcescens]MBH3305915.1 hypothetical protein [Serratia marcescens]
MSIIHLKSRTTTNSNDFERNKKSFNSKLFLCYEDERSNPNRNNVHIDEFSLDLTLGNSWNENYSYNDKGLFIIENGKISIPARTSVVVTVRETMKVPNNIFGIVMSTGSIFLQDGIQSPSAKIEPGYSGTLKLRLVNYSAKKVELTKGQKIGSAIFFQTDHTPDFIEASNSESTNIPKKGRVKRAWNIFKQQWLSYGPNFISMLISVVAIIFTMLNYFK